MRVAASEGNVTEDRPFDLRSLAADFVAFATDEDSWGPLGSAPADAQAAEVGDVWHVAVEGRVCPLLFMVSVVDEGHLRGVPVLDEVLLAGDGDVIVPAESSPTGSPIAVCAWHDTPLASGALLAFEGSLPPRAVEAACMLLQDSTTGGFERRPYRRERMSTGEPALAWTIRSVGQPDTGVGYLTGAPLVEPNDPRAAVREAITRVCQRLEASVLVGLDDLRDGDGPPRLERMAEIAWMALPAAARAQTVRWPDVELPLDDRALLLVDGVTNRADGTTTFQVRAARGKRYPVVRVALALLRRDGTLLGHEGGEPLKVGDTACFRGIDEPQDIAAVCYSTEPAGE